MSKDLARKLHYVLSVYCKLQFFVIYLYCRILSFDVSYVVVIKSKKKKKKKITTSIKLTRNCSKEHILHSYYPTPIKAFFQHLSIRPLEQTVKFVCS